MPLNDLLIVEYDANLVRECVALGLRPVLVRNVWSHLNGNDQPLPENTVEVVVESTSEIGGVWSGLIRHLGRGFAASIAGVVTYDEFSVATAAALATLLDLPGPSLEQAGRMRDKNLQKSVVRAAGVRTAESEVVVPGSPRHAATYRHPSVIKPIAGGGTKSTHVVDSEDDFHALMTRLASDPSTPYVVESLIDVQDEWSVDGVVEDGSLVFASIGLYSAPCIEFTRSPIPYEILRVEGTGRDSERADAIAISEAALAALGYNNGVFHLELLRDNSGTFHFGECAARTGGMMIGESVMRKHEFSMARAAVELAINSPVNTSTTQSKDWVASSTLRSRPGTIVHLPSESELLAPTYMYDVWLSSTVGAVVSQDSKSYLDSQGLCVVSGGNSDDLKSNLLAARAAFYEQVIVAPTHDVRARQRAFSNPVASQLRRPE